MMVRSGVTAGTAAAAFGGKKNKGEASGREAFGHVNVNDREAFGHVNVNELGRQ